MCVESGLLSYKPTKEQTWVALSNCNVVSKPVPSAVIDEDCTGALVIKVLNDSDKVIALMLYFLIVAHKAACHTLSKAFLKSMKTL